MRKHVRAHLRLMHARNLTDLDEFFFCGYPVSFAKLSSSRPVLVKLNWDYLNIILTPPTHPLTRKSIFELLLDYLGS